MDMESRRDGRGVYKFGEFVLNVTERDLVRGTTQVHLAPKTFDVLVVLVARAGRLVTKHEILDQVWPKVFVEEGILTVHVAQLRKALGDVKGARRYIETVPRSGYRFRADVRSGAARDLYDAAS